MRERRTWLPFFAAAAVIAIVAVVLAERINRCGSSRRHARRNREREVGAVSLADRSSGVQSRSSAARGA